MSSNLEANRKSYRASLSSYGFSGEDLITLVISQDILEAVAKEHDVEKSVVVMSVLEKDLPPLFFQFVEQLVKKCSRAKLKMTGKMKPAKVDTSLKSTGVKPDNKPTTGDGKRSGQGCGRGAKQQPANQPGPGKKKQSEVFVLHQTPQKVAMQLAEKRKLAADINQNC